MMQVVEGFFFMGKDDQLGATSLEIARAANDAETGTAIGTTTANTPANVPAPRQQSEGFFGKGITISAARYASEEAALLVHYVIAILEYSKNYWPLKAAKEKVELVRQDLENYEKQKAIQEAEVCVCLIHI